MSDSEDDAPLVIRKGGSTSAAAAKQEAADKGSKDVKTEQPEPAKGARPAPQPGSAAQVKEEPGTSGRPHAADKKAPVAAKAGGAQGKGLKVESDGAAAGGGAASTKGKAGKDTDKQPREKKEFDMPGQTRETPPETDSLRKFYTSLLSQRPDSEMAKKWCLTHGLLPREEAEEMMAAKGKAGKGAAAIKSPVKAPARGDSRAAASKAKRPVERAAPAKKQKFEAPIKQRATYSDDDSEDGDDMDDKPIAAKAKAPAARRPAAAAAKRVTKDVAFSDGGLGSDDDDDDKPLVVRARKA